MMFEQTTTRHAVATMVGGALLSIALGLDDVAPEYAGVAVVVPVLIGFGVLEIYRRYRRQYGSLGRAGVVLTSIGLGLMLMAILLYAVVPPVFYAVFLVAVPGVPAIVSLGLGSAFLALVLYRLGVIRVTVAGLLGTGVPFAPLLHVLITGVIEPGSVLAPAVPAGAFTALAGTPYGVGWLLIGHGFWKTAGGDREVERTQRVQVVELSPHAVTAGLGGAIVVFLNLGRFVPMGPLSSSPWVDHGLALDIGQLVVGAAGLVVAAQRDGELQRRYTQVVGLLSFLLVTLVYFGTIRTVGWLAGTPVGLLEMQVPGLLLYLAVGVVLTVVGFGIDGGRRTE